MPFLDHILQRPSYRWQDAAISGYQDYKNIFMRNAMPYLQSKIATGNKANLANGSGI